MTNKEAIEKIIFDYKFKEKVESGYVYHTEIPFMEAIANIKKDLEMLEFIKKHYVMNGFNELIPIYLDNDDHEKFNELERWLENEK